jgi:S-adenosylmethionine synthetase
MTRKYTFTSESVTEGHPDKMADQISDSVLDAILAEDPHGRVACETLLTTGLCVVAGEITTSAYVDIPKLARETIKSIGYDNAAYGFDGNTCGVIISIDEQSSDIAMGVDKSEELRGGKSGEDKLNSQGAGDQGMMFGYACDETPELMPLPIWLAHRLAEQLTEVRKSGAIPYLRPDGKTQVTFDYEDGVPVRLRTVLISSQHADGINRDTVIRPDLIEQVSTSTRRENSSRADHTPTLVSRAARSSSTRMAAWVVMAAVRSAEKIHQKSTDQPLTLRAGWLSTW